MYNGNSYYNSFSFSSSSSFTLKWYLQEGFATFILLLMNKSCTLADKAHGLMQLLNVPIRLPDFLIKAYNS